MALQSVLPEIVGRRMSGELGRMISNEEPSSVAVGCAVDLRGWPVLVDETFGQICLVVSLDRTKRLWYSIIAWLAE